MDRGGLFAVAALVLGLVLWLPGDDPEQTSPPTSVPTPTTAASGDP